MKIFDFLTESWDKSHSDLDRYHVLDEIHQALIRIRLKQLPKERNLLDSMREIQFRLNAITMRESFVQIAKMVSPDTTMASLGAAVDISLARRADRILESMEESEGRAVHASRRILAENPGTPHYVIQVECPICEAKSGEMCRYGKTS